MFFAGEAGKKHPNPRFIEMMHLPSRWFLTVLRAGLSLGLAALLLLALAWAVRAEPAAAPTAVLHFNPNPALNGRALRAAADYNDPDGDPEGLSRYRWQVNGSPIMSGTVAQSLLLAFDGSLLGSSGWTPSQQEGLAYTDGRWNGGQALHFSPAQNSRLRYPAQERISAAQGSFETWLRLSQDLSGAAYDGYPRLLSYVIDSEHQLYIEVNADRLIITTRFEGKYAGVWPDPPDWKAGEWRHLAVTWSAAEGRAEIYYDCELAATTSKFPDLGAAPAGQQFNLGSGANGNVLAADLDDVRLSRRVLSAAEIAAACTRGGPAPNDETLLPAEYFQTGDEVAFALTLCDVNGDCGPSAVLTTTVSLRPLGELAPASGMLPSGTLSVSLSLTTTLPADCRFSENPNTPYAQMSQTFQPGSGGLQHSALTSGWSDLQQRAFYVRCADRSGGRDPDSDERSASLRVMGPFAGDYPRIANLWGTYDPTYGLDFFSSYDFFVVGSWNGYGNQAAEIRARNPNAKILLSENATYGWPESDELTAEWWNSAPDDPGYNCLLRDTAQDIITIGYWGHPMYNLLEAACREQLVQQSIAHYLAAQPALSYDGLYWDRLHDSISWFSPEIDSNLDGLADEPAALDAAYIAGLQDFLSRVRAALPHAVLMGNDANQVYYDAWVNGRLYEWQLASLMEVGQPGWLETVDSYRDWLGRGPLPRLTFIESSPERLFEEKYTFLGLDQIPPAMMAEAQAAYRQMRFGLTTALMGDGMFSFDYGPDAHGQLWWYDEFGLARGQAAGANDLPHGYLGQPLGEPFLLQDHLDTPNPLLNPGFEDGLASWNSYVNSGAGAAASFSAQAGQGTSGAWGLEADVQSAGPNYWNVEFYQKDLSLIEDVEYTLSFWARSEVTRTLHASLRRQTSPWTDYGLSVEAIITPQWQHFHLVGAAKATAADAKLQFFFGDQTGKLWLDEVQFQQGALGVWARRYQGGLALVNTTHQVQELPLPGLYQKINGAQAPLYAVRQDDDEITADPAWVQTAATAGQFGQTVHTSAAGVAGSAAYKIKLPYAGQYEISLWVAPAAGQAAAMPVTVYFPGGQKELTVNLSGSGDPGWRSLGVYACSSGDDCVVELHPAAAGLAVADAVKWQSLARYNDGRLTRSVSLQPLDGIVLLNVSPRVYLPLARR